MSYINFIMRKSTVRLRTGTFDRLCANAGLISIGDMCQRMGISRSQMTKVRCHRCQPGPRFIHAALDTLGVSYSDLFERIDQDCELVSADDMAEAA